MGSYYIKQPSNQKPAVIFQKFLIFLEEFFLPGQAMTRRLKQEEGLMTRS